MDTRITCPCCQETAKLRTEVRSLTYKDEDYKVTTWFYKCVKCQKEFTTTESDERTLKNLYAQHNMKNKKPLIDYDNTKQLAEDIWLFLTSDKMPDKATVKKSAFIHEVTTMIDVVRQHEQTKALAKRV